MLPQEKLPDGPTASSDPPTEHHKQSSRGGRKVSGRRAIWKRKVGKRILSKAKKTKAQ